jgi:preprotein translocase subunit SecD/SecD/SecF fusion protein
VLYFSKLKIVVIYSVIAIFSLFTFLNFVNNDDSFLLSKKVNLGLDLQGGSYLLLEVNSSPVIKQKLQDKLLLLRKHLKEKKIKYKKLKIENNFITFNILNEEVENFSNFFTSKDNLINLYYPQYNSSELELSIEKNIVFINFTKFGIVEIKKKNSGTIFRNSS